MAGLTVVDPFDPKNTFSSVGDAIKKYPGLMPTSGILARAIDQLASRPDLSAADVSLDITGTGAPQKIAHGMKDASGTKLKPRAWQLVGFSDVATFRVLSLDDTNIELVISNKGVVTLALFS